MSLFMCGMLPPLGGWTPCNSKEVASPLVAIPLQIAREFSSSKHETNTVPFLTCCHPLQRPQAAHIHHWAAGVSVLRARSLHIPSTETAPR